MAAALTDCSDTSIKMFIQHLEEDKVINGGQSFILADLGDEGVFVKKEALREIQSHVSDMLDANHFAVELAKH